MKKLLCAVLAALLAILPAACPAESADGFQPRLDPDTACTITVIGSYSNFAEAIPTLKRWKRSSTGSTSIIRTWS